MTPSDHPGVLALARSLGAWFNAEGLTRIEIDLPVQAGVVAKRAGGLVGFALWAPRTPASADLTWMGVDEDAQRNGIGTALLSAVANAVRRRGMRTLEVSTVADNVDYAPYERTRRFYRSRGFRDVRVDAGFYGQGADRYDRLVLALDL